MGRTGNAVRAEVSSDRNSEGVRGVDAIKHVSCQAVGIE
jgi:hypothetical protein